MSYFARLSCSTALVTAMLPHLAMAEVTADDVWRNQVDYLATLGGDLDVTTARSGNILSVTKGSWSFQLPFESGSVVLSMPDFDMVENGDGTVTFAYPGSITYGMAVDIVKLGTFGGKIDITMKGESTVASGTPGDVTYTWSVERLDFQGRDMKVHNRDPSSSAPKDITITGKGSFSDMSGTARVRVAELVTVDSNTTIGRQDMTIGGGADNSQFTFTGVADSVVSSGQLALPRNGMDIMNLAAALRDGLAVSGTAKTIGYHTTQNVEENGKVVSNEDTKTREQSMQYAFDQNGVKFHVAAFDSEIAAQPSAEIPFPLKFRLDKAEGGMTLPLSASSELQDVVYDFTLSGLDMAEDIWALFDPQQTLPRDPMTVTVDLSAKVLNKVDWLDFLTVKAVIDSGEVPVELHEMTLHELDFDMAGARLTGSGAGVFDNSDLESLGGFPKPTGVIDLVLGGGNGLLDNLVTMGLLSDEDAMGARMAVAVFTQPDPDAGEDVLKSRLEMTEEGHVLANGQRLQ